jgi:hypothetical protein
MQIEQIKDSFFKNTQVFSQSYFFENLQKNIKNLKEKNNIFYNFKYYFKYYFYYLFFKLNNSFFKFLFKKTIVFESHFFSKFFILLNNIIKQNFVLINSMNLLKQRKSFFKSKIFNSRNKINNKYFKKNNLFTFFFLVKCNPYKYKYYKIFRLRFP